VKDMSAKNATSPGAMIAVVSREAYFAAIGLSSLFGSSSSLLFPPTPFTLGCQRVPIPKPYPAVGG